MCMYIGLKHKREERELKRAETAAKWLIAMSTNKGKTLRDLWKRWGLVIAYMSVARKQQKRHLQSSRTKAKAKRLFARPKEENEGKT